MEVKIRILTPTRPQFIALRNLRPPYLSSIRTSLHTSLVILIQFRGHGESYDLIPGTNTF